MPRHPRLFLPGGVYHVYCRVARAEFVFDDELEAKRFIDKLCRVRDLDSWTVFAWCLMGNHYHLVLKTREIALWRSMARLQGSISRSYNKRNGFLGRLWQGRYGARVIDSTDYFRQAVSYVHMNPVAAGIVSDPSEYLLSGHREVMGLCRPRVVNSCETLHGFDTSAEAEPVDAYLNGLRSVARAQWFTPDVTRLPWWDDAKHDDEIADARRHPSATRFDGHTPAEERPALGVFEFAARMDALSGHSVADLASRRRGDDLTSGRIEFCALAIGRHGLRVCDVSFLLRKHPNSVTKWLNQGLQLENQDPGFRERLDDLDSRVSMRA